MEKTRSQIEELEIESEEESDKLESIKQKCDTYSKQFVRNLTNASFDELNPKTKMDFLTSLMEAMLKDCEIGLSDEDESDENSIKNKIKNTRKALRIKEKSSSKKRKT